MRTVSVLRRFFFASILTFLFCVLRAAAEEPGAPGGQPLWRDPAQPLESRIRDLVGRMTLDEKVQQVCNIAPSIPRLGLPAYNYWNECLHGVGRNGIATVFPQAIGMAASFDPVLLHTVADAIATEARAKNREYTEAHNGDSVNYTGLSFWSPNINIFRDPRWGRGQETYGEDPFLTARMAVAYIQGLQGDDPKYVKAMACAKHFAVHSGPEIVRHSFDAEPSERDFHEMYLPQFEAAVREGHVGAVMGAYNRIYGTPCCASPLLLSNLLRGQWGFKGQVVSDCGAISDFFYGHGFSPTIEAAAATAVKAGCDLCCGTEYQQLADAVGDKLLEESQLDTAVGRLLEARFRLGLFDPPALVPYSKIAATDYDTPANDALSLRMARESVVLLKNDGLLPLDRTKIHKIAVMGLNAFYTNTLLGNYEGVPSHPVTFADGIATLLGTNVSYILMPACPWAVRVGDDNLAAYDTARAKAVEAAQSVDAVIYVGGICADLEREFMNVPFEGFNHGDRTRIELPPIQTEFLKAVQATGKPLVFVNCSGSAMAMPWEADHLSAIVQAWYPGQEGGKAVAEVLFGDVNPAGRLPITFYASTSDLPSFLDYSMADRTYRYFKGKPLFAFGHGLSYTQFKYDGAQLDKAQVNATDTVHVKLDVANIGSRDGDEVVQVYFRHVNSAVPQPLEALCGFRRVPVAVKQVAHLDIPVPVKEFRYWDTSTKEYVIEPGDYEILVGAASDDIRAKLPLRVE
ncbi:MAG TPA: glycoside hydrolase family 3 C-terminal domain-containing protein [Candidatus Baltobacteraceae bacterium]|jgi:beta-glucosidase|nr:glycoside hydrolase family 3 C-terminal domain-containing protein [Candidatus Baltobacteraceae bacterium]